MFNVLDVQLQHICPFLPIARRGHALHSAYNEAHFSATLLNLGVTLFIQVNTRTKYAQLRSFANKRNLCRHLQQYCLPTPSSSQVQLQAVQSEVLWPDPQPSHKQDGELGQSQQSKHLVQVVAQPLPPVQLCKTFAPLFSFSSYTTSPLR